MCAFPSSTGSVEHGDARAERVERRRRRVPMRSRISARWLCSTPRSRTRAGASRRAARTARARRQVAELGRQVGPARIDPGDQVGLDGPRPRALEQPPRRRQSPTDQGLEARLMELVGAPHPPILAGSMSRQSHHGRQPRRPAAAGVSCGLGRGSSAAATRPARARPAISGAANDVPLQSPKPPRWRPVGARRPEVVRSIDSRTRPSTQVLRRRLQPTLERRHRAHHRRTRGVGADPVPALVNSASVRVGVQRTDRHHGTRSRRGGPGPCRCVHGANAAG